TQRRTRLLHYRRDVAGLGVRSYESRHEWFPALAAAYADFSLDVRPLAELIDGCESDLDRVDVRTTVEMEAYARAVAGTVGRCVIPILGASDADSLKRAERLGIAMQYTNILRDVADDRAMGRNYLPLAEFPHETASSVMRRVAAKARRYYREASPLHVRLPNDGSRAAFLMASSFYERILRGIEARCFDPEGSRVVVSGARKLELAARCMITAYTGLAIIR
ncbi:MAG TPA: squalene/phytoene synthase family protein, partial [Rudaea sp.]|nr:squalene/phytoene synthase family protein [Rudaea sp.]